MNGHVKYAAMRSELLEIKLAALPAGIRAALQSSAKKTVRPGGGTQSAVQQALREVVGKAPKVKPTVPKDVSYVRSIMGG